LEEFLPHNIAKDLRSNSVNHNTGDNDELAFVNAVTGESVGMVGGVPWGQPGAFIRAGREAFRSFLWQGFQVRANRQFTHYKTDNAGVTAHFADGSTARGKLLVGADGLHSRVLDQLIGVAEHQPVLSRYIPLFGEVDLGPEQYEPLRRIATAAIQTSGPGMRQMIGMLSMSEDRSTSHWFWALMPRRDDPQALSDWIQHATKDELYNYAIESTKSLHPIASDIIKHGGPEAILDTQPKFMEFVTPQLPEGRVTVLGDAAHAMVRLTE
jgi:2-polyprenyl-6-methoxyphenol hydroxylase-like FAD-dependent oxidoreductase